MLDSNRTSQLREAIAIHLQNIGPEKWDLVRADFPEISSATFWRRVKEVRQELGEPLAAKTPAVGQSGTAVSTDLAQEDIPQFGFYRPLQQSLRLRQLFADAEILKQQSLDKHGKILNHTMYTKSITLRESLLNSELQMVERWATINTQTEFYARVIDTVSAASPEVAQKIMFELGMLNEECRSKTDPHT
jgi:hypothetical protein